MALPERKQVEEELLDPAAVQRAYRRKRPPRWARAERARERRLAGVRFLVRGRGGDRDERCPRDRDLEPDPPPVRSLIADTAHVASPESFPPEQDEPYFEVEQEVIVGRAGGFWALGGRLTWVAALVLTVSAFTDWYAQSGLAGPTIAVIGWHTGTLGKLVFVIGALLLLLVILRELGFELPPTVPESLVVIALGSLATIFVLIRLISIPDSIPPPAGRGIRHLDQPGGCGGRDRRRASTSIRRAVAPRAPGRRAPRRAKARPRRPLRRHRPRPPPGRAIQHYPFRPQTPTAPPGARPPPNSQSEKGAAEDVERPVHADIDTRRRDRGREDERGDGQPGRSPRDHRRAGEGDRSVAGGKHAGVRHSHERLGLRIDERRSVAADPLAQAGPKRVGEGGRREHEGRSSQGRRQTIARSSAATRKTSPSVPIRKRSTNSQSSQPTRWWTTQRSTCLSTPIRSAAAASSARSARAG